VRPTSAVANKRRIFRSGLMIYAYATLWNPERKLSPIGIRALKLYKDVCVRLLDLEEGETFEKELEAAIQTTREQ
jgi:hypothetical protein